MDSFSLLDAVLLLGVGQGLFLCVSIPFIGGQYKSTNRILALIVLFATIMLSGRILVYRVQGDWVSRVASFVDITIFLFGPLIFLYIKRLLSGLKETPMLAWWHFLPAFVHFMYSIWTIYIPFDVFHTLYLQGKLSLVLFLMEGVGLLSLIIYWVFSLKIVYKKVVSVKIYSTRYNITIRQYLIFFTTSIGLLITFWLVGFVAIYFFQEKSASVTYSMMWTMTPVFLYIVGFFSLTPSEVLKSPVFFKKKEDRVSVSESMKLQHRLDILIREEKIYNQPNLSLKSLAEKLETTPNNVSWLLNNKYQKSFYDFINERRVKAFQAKVENREHDQKTLLGLAMDVGFNSKSTFNKVFKLHVGDTPSHYVKNLQQGARKRSTLVHSESK